MKRAAPQPPGGLLFFACIVKHEHQRRRSPRDWRHLMRGMVATLRLLEWTSLYRANTNYPTIPTIPALSDRRFKTKIRPNKIVFHECSQIQHSSECYFTADFRIPSNESAVCRSGAGTKYPFPLSIRFEAHAAPREKFFAREILRQAMKVRA
jgi:hypothetical protein